MLCQFSVKNYKSIRDEITFDLQAAAISEHADWVIKDRDGQVFLPVSAVYGPNGAGKSNVLEAMQTLVTMVLRPIHVANQNASADYKFTKHPVRPFAFSEEWKRKPTEFEIFFRTKLAEYRYVLQVKEDVVVYERMDRVRLKTGKKSVLFLRDGEDLTLKGAVARLKVSEGLSRSLPLLSYLGITYTSNEVVKDAIDWFEYGIDFLNFGNPLEGLRAVVSSSGEIKKLVLACSRKWISILKTSGSRSGKITG